MNDHLVPLTPVDDTVAAAEINARHAQTMAECQRCSEPMHRALLLGKETGELLLNQKKVVKRQYGHGAWEPWLKKHFTGSIRTAQQYMQLAKSATGVAELQNLSLRQAYRKLGMAGRQEKQSADIPVPPVPEHLRIVNRFLRWSRKSGAATVQPFRTQVTLRHDLRPVYDWLRELFHEGDAQG